MSRKAETEFNSRALYLRLLTFVRPYRWTFALAILCMIGSSALEPAFPALLKYLLDDGFAQTQGRYDWLLYPALVFAIFFFRAVFGLIADYAMTWVSQRVIADLRLHIFENLLKLPCTYFNDNISGRLISRVTSDVNGVSSAATSAITTVIKDSFSIIGLLGWLLYLNWQLTIITFITAPLIAVAVRGFNGRIRKLARGLQSVQGELTQVLQEAVEGQKVVKIFGGQKFETQRFSRVIKEQRHLYMRSALALAVQGPIVHFFVALAVSIIMAIALYQAGHGQASAGDFVSFITAMLMMLAPLRRLTDVNATIQRGLIAAESVFHVVDEAKEPDQGQRMLTSATGLIEFDQVVFAYPGSERPALQALSFYVNPGESVALVGPSGSGKTTVANLLPRFYDVQNGEIRVDGIPIKDLTLASLRANISLVSQDILLFNDTVAANISYGCTQPVSMADIAEAARDAYATEFIDCLPGGFDAMLGERGVKLSGGQRQRIAIARALLKNSPILILDEATSALDTESERQVQAALDRLMIGRSTIVIAHRLSTVERASRIVVLQNGQKLEEGTHAELLAGNGLYQRLQQMQSVEVLSD